MLKDRLNLPLIEMLDHMHSGNRIGVVVRKRKVCDVADNIGLLVRFPSVRVRVTPYPSVPVNIATSEVEEDSAFWITVLHAFACV